MFKRILPLIVVAIFLVSACTPTAVPTTAPTAVPTTAPTSTTLPEPYTTYKVYPPDGHQTIEVECQERIYSLTLKVLELRQGSVLIQGFGWVPDGTQLELELCGVVLHAGEIRVESDHVKFRLFNEPVILEDCTPEFNFGDSFSA